MSDEKYPQNAALECRIFCLDFSFVHGNKSSELRLRKSWGVLFAYGHKNVSGAFRRRRLCQFPHKNWETNKEKWTSQSHTLIQFVSKHFHSFCVVFLLLSRILENIPQRWTQVILEILCPCIYLGHLYNLITLWQQTKNVSSGVSLLTAVSHSRALRRRDGFKCHNISSHPSSSTNHRNVSEGNHLI